SIKLRHSPPGERFRSRLATLMKLRMIRFLVPVVPLSTVAAGAAIIIFSLCIQSSAVAASANPSGVGLQAALDSMKQFTNADGLEATLFAAEPMVVNPTDIDVDSQGRVWV